MFSDDRAIEKACLSREIIDVLRKHALSPPESVEVMLDLILMMYIDAFYETEKEKEDESLS